MPRAIDFDEMTRTPFCHNSSLVDVIASISAPMLCISPFVR